MLDENTQAIVNELIKIRKAIKSQYVTIDKVNEE
jgi:hypothetical protein